MTMDVTYQLMEQLAAAVSTTGQTGAKRDAGTQNKSDGGFDTMVRQKQQEAKDADKAADTESEAPAAADETLTDEDRAAMAAMLMQPQPVIMYVESETGTEAVSELLPKEAELEIPALPEQAAEIPEPPEEAEIADLPVQTLTERPAEAPAQDTETRTTDTADIQPVQTDAVAAEKVMPDRESGGAELSADTREEENEAPAELSASDAPVFGYMDATPFRVAVSGTAPQPLDLTAADAAEELGARIESLLTNEAGDTKVELTLSPANLGKLTLEITHGADGSLHVQLLASTEKAAALLEKNASALQNLLAARERPQTTVEIRVEERAQQFLNPDGQRRDQNGAYQQQQQQQQQRGSQREALRVEDFMSRLRLGLVGLDAAI